MRMIVEVEGSHIELDWRDTVMLLTLLWVKLKALSPSFFHSVDPDPGRLRSRIERLKSLGLLKEVKLGRGSIIYLTDLGLQVASLLEKRAAELGLL